MFCDEKSEMPKLSKRRKANLENSKKGGHHLNLDQSNNQNDGYSDQNDSDEDFVYGAQPVA